MKRNTNLLTLSALAVPLVALLAGRWLVARQLRQNVADLFSQTETGPAKTYDPTRLTGLPAPVQRYFRHVLKPDQPYVRSVRLRHDDGQFKTWLVNRRAGSLIPALLFHTAVNYWSWIVPVIPNGGSLRPYALATGLMVLIALVLLLRKKNRTGFR